MALGTVVILVPAGGVPRWMREVVDAAAGVAGAVAVATVEGPGGPIAPSTRAYLAVDRRLFAVDDRGPAQAPAAAAAAGNADVVVRLAPGATGWSGRLGELALLVCGAPVGGDEPAVLDRLAWGAATIDTDLCWRRPGAPARIVASARSAAAPPSVHRTRDAALAAAAGLVQAGLRLVAAGQHDEPSPPPAASDGGSARPAAVAAAMAGLRGGRRVVAGRARERAKRPCWRIAWRRSGRDLVAGDGGGFRILAAPAGEHRADPFLLADDGRHHLFFEQVPAGESKGVIAHAELRPDGTTSQPTVVLEHDTHLSYPFVFRRGGVAYMIPETQGRGRIELYRAERVPDRWVLERVLVDGVRAVDATLFEDGGRLWLFASVAERRERISSQLSLYSAEELDGEWRPHPANPVVRDVTRARPAGRIVRRGGAIIRPGQDCAGRYGAAIALNRIDVLSADRYAETTTRRLRPSRRLASHTWNADDAFEVVDVVVRGR